MDRWVSVSVVVTVGLLLAFVWQPVTGQSQTYDISVDGSIDTPDKDITFEGDSYRVSAVKQADPGDTVTADIEAPSNQLVKVLIYNSDRQIVTQKQVTGAGSVSFDLSGYSSGSYMFAIQYSGDTKRIYPLVVRAYDVSMTAPSEATAGDSIDLSATLTELRSASKSGVEFVIANDGDSLRIDATENSGTYEATADLSALDTGEYSVYATVRGTKEIDGNKVRLGLSDPASLTISEQQTTQTQTSSDDGGNNNDGGGGGDGDGSGNGDTGGSVTTSTSTTTAPPTTTTTDPVTTNSSTTTESMTTVETTQEPGRSSTTTDDTGTTTAMTAGSTTESGVDSQPTTGSDAITPRPTTDGSQSQAQATTPGSGPGFGSMVAILAIATVGALLGRRRQ